MEIVIHVTNVEGVSIDGFSLRIDYNPPLPDVSSGFPINAPDTLSSVRLEVQHVDYYGESVLIERVGSTFHLNNATVVLQASLPAKLVVTLTLSRIRIAPLDTTAQSQIDLGLTVPSGVLIDDLNAPFDYRGFINAGPVSGFHRLLSRRTQLIKKKWSTALADPTQKNWSWYNHETLLVEPQAVGTIRWVEFGKIPDPVYLLALWIPRQYYSKRQRQDSSVDYHVFYSPTTKDKDSYYGPRMQPIYPYGLYKWTENGQSKANQPFIVHLGERYLFRHAIIQQSIASKKAAVVVMPINRYGDWGPFLNLYGLQRVLQELNHLMTKMQLLTDRPISDSMQRLNLHPAQSVASDAVRRTTLGKVAISGFSSGVAAVNSLLTVSKPSAPRYGLSYVNDATLIQRTWQELWDVDLSPSRTLTMSMDAFTKKLLDWKTTDRQFRMIHSSYTAGNWLPAQSSVLAPLIRRKQATVMPSAFGAAQECYSNDFTWSIHVFNDLYLTRSTATNLGPPDFPDADPGHENQHHFIPQIGLGLSAVLSTLDDFV